MSRSSPTTAAPASRNNRLTLAEAHKLNTWLGVTDLEALPTQTAAGIAEEAAKALGFVVTGANVNASAEAIGRPLPRSRRAIKGDATSILASALMGLYKVSGLVAPADLVALTQERIES